MDRRLQGRVDPSDVLQEAYLDMAKRLADSAASARVVLDLSNVDFIRSALIGQLVAKNCR